MNYLSNILDEDSLTNIIETYDISLLNKLDTDNIRRIIEYLKDNNIDYIEDILSLYTDLLIMPAPEFIKKFEILKAKYNPNFINTLAYNLSLLESMWEI